MQEEILSLKLRISEQEEVLKGTVQRLRSTSRTKESMEHFIVNQCKCVLYRVCTLVRCGSTTAAVLSVVLCSVEDS